MAFVETISLGEVVVGAGTLILAVVTVVITGWQIREARRLWKRGVDREYKRKLLDEFEGWLQSVIRALNEDPYRARNWARGDEEDYFNEKAKLLEKLLHLSDPAFYLSKKIERPFQEYDLAERFEKLRDKYGDCTDMLHDIVANKPDGVGGEVGNCEIGLLNMVNESYKYIIEIREKEKI